MTSNSDSDSDSDSDFGPHSGSGFDDLLTVHPTELKIPFDFNEEEHYSCSIQLTNITDRIVAYEPTPSMTSASDFFGPHRRFDELLTVQPTELKIPFDFNEEEHYSCSIQLTNITDRIVAYTFWCSFDGLLVSPDEVTYVGIILPHSTCSVTMKLAKKALSDDEMWNEPSPEDKEWIEILASVVKDGVKAEDITCWDDLFHLIDKKWGNFLMPVDYYYTVPAADPSSAVPDMARNSSRVICDSPPYSRLPFDSSDKNTDSLSEENINSGGKKKRTRGKTKVLWEKNRTMIEWNEYGQPVGKNSDGFSTTAGCLVRENVPININSWHDVDKRIKENLWDLMMQKYVIEDCRKKFILRLMGKLWRNWKSYLSRNIRKDEENGGDVPRHIDSLKPNESTKHEWDEFVKSRTSDKFKELSQTKQTARAKQTMPCTLGRKGYARLKHERKIENTCKFISREDLWIEGHKKKKGQPINDAAEKAISEMEKYKEHQNNGNSTSINEDPVSKYFGPERSCSVRGLGFGVTPYKIEAQLQNKSWMQSVRPDMFPGELSNGRALPSPSSRQTDDAMLTARLNTFERSITELRALSERTDRSVTDLATATERNMTAMQGTQVAMGDQLARMQNTVAQSSTRLASVMDSYNARLLALEQIRPPGSSVSTPTPSFTLPLPSASVTLSQEQYKFLLSQIRDNPPPPDQP